MWALFVLNCCKYSIVCYEGVFVQIDYHAISGKYGSTVPFHRSKWKTGKGNDVRSIMHFVWIHEPSAWTINIKFSINKRLYNCIFAMNYIRFIGQIVVVDNVHRIAIPVRNHFYSTLANSFVRKIIRYMPFATIRNYSIVFPPMYEEIYRVSCSDY